MIIDKICLMPKQALFCLIMCSCFTQNAVSQQPTFHLYEGQVNWLEENHFPIHIYQWDSPKINALLQQSVEKRSLGYLSKSTLEWMDYILTDEYSGQEYFRKSQHVKWLKRRNIHINYYHGKNPALNQDLNQVLRTRSFVDFTNITGIATGTIGGVLFLVSSVQYILSAALCFSDCDAHLNGIGRRVNTGLSLTITGTSIWLIGRLIGGNRKSRLKSFTKSWYYDFQGY